MAVKSILSDKQNEILNIISRSDYISRRFYLTGGTALSEFYLKHRLSEDLDFFCEEEFDPQAIAVFWEKHKKELRIKEVNFEQSFNRNLFFLKLPAETIKTEFTYFPFPRIEKKKKINKLQIDSLLDIAVNKVFTIYQKPRSRDFIDLFLICRNEKWKMASLVSKAKIKFDWHIDPIQLGTQFLQAATIKDYPRMLEKIDNAIWINFFLNEAKKLGKEKILK